MDPVLKEFIMADLNTRETPSKTNCEACGDLKVNVLRVYNDGVLFMKNAWKLLFFRTAKMIPFDNICLDCMDHNIQPINLPECVAYLKRSMTDEAIDRLYISLKIWDVDGSVCIRCIRPCRRVNKLENGKIVSCFGSLFDSGCLEFYPGPPDWYIDNKWLCDKCLIRFISSNRVFITNYEGYKRADKEIRLVPNDT